MLVILEQLGVDSKHHPVAFESRKLSASERAIVNEPVLLLADEPTGNLDSHTSEEIMALFQDLNRQGKTVVIVTHEEEIALHCKRIIRFKDGRVLVDEKVKNQVDAREVLKGMPEPD